MPLYYAALCWEYGVTIDTHLPPPDRKGQHPAPAIRVSVAGKPVESCHAFKAALTKLVQARDIRALVEIRTGAKVNRQAALPRQGVAGSGVTLFPPPLAKNRLAFLFAAKYSPAQRSIILKMTHNEWPTRSLQALRAKHRTGSSSTGLCRYGCGHRETIHHVLAGDSGQPGHPPGLASLGQARHAALLKLVEEAVDETGGYEVVSDKIPEDDRSPEMSRLLALLKEFKGPYSRPDLVLLHTRTALIKIIDVSFANDEHITRNDAIRSLIKDQPQWWSDKGEMKGLEATLSHARSGTGVMVFGEQPHFGDGLSSEALAKALSADGRKIPAAQRHANNPLIPPEWDSADALHTAEDTLFQAKQSLLVKGDFNQAKLQCAQRHWYSPRARYLNKYRPLLLHLRQGMGNPPATTPPLADSKESPARVSPATDEVIPLVMGHCGTPTNALLAAASTLLCADQKTNRRAVKMCSRATWIAWDYGLKFHAQWF
jgi:hypothetical protein